MAPPTQTAGAALLVLSLGLLYVGLLWPVIHYTVVFKFELPMLGAQSSSLEGQRSLMAKADGVVPQLFQDQAYFAAGVIAMMGLGLPLIKLALVGLWAKGNQKALVWARMLSKWTLVDAFAEALLVALLLHADVQAETRIGYASFVAYAVVSHLGLCLLGEPEVAAPRSRRLGAALTAPALGFGFAAFMVLGCQMLPLASLLLAPSAILASVTAKIDSYPGASMFASMLGKSTADLARDVAGQVHISSEVTLSSAVASLLQQPEWCTVIGSLVLCSCLLLLPCADVALSVHALAGAKRSYEPLRLQLRDFACLDVFVAGLFVCCLLSRNVHQLGVAPLRGLGCLVVAAACQHGLHHLATKAEKCEQAEEQESILKAA